MSYRILDRELWFVANAIRKYFKRTRFKAKVEKPAPEDWGFRPTFVFDKRAECCVVEITRKPHLENYFKDFVINRKAQRDPIKIYLGIPEELEGEPNIAYHKIINT